VDCICINRLWNEVSALKRAWKMNGGNYNGLIPIDVWPEILWAAV